MNPVVGDVPLIGERLMREVLVSDEKLQVVPWWHALCWGQLLAGCGNMLQVCIGQVRPSFSCSHQWPSAAVNPLRMGALVCEPVMIVMLHASDTWAVTIDTLNCLQHNDYAMIHWISGFKLGTNSRKKWPLPPGKLWRSNSRIGRSYSAKIMTFSVNLKANLPLHILLPLNGRRNTIQW